VNILLFEDRDAASLIPSADPRARHVREVLKLGVGDPVYVGVINGVRGKGVIVEQGSEWLRLDIDWEGSPLALHPVRLLVGLPRPHTARRVLFEAACLGVERIDFFSAEKGEPSYARSKLWSTNEWRERLVLGLEQSFATLLPAVGHYPDLPAALAASTAETRLALDVYEGEGPLSEFAAGAGARLELAVGPERGWAAGERRQLRAAGFRLAHLGERVLRTEAAVVAGLSVVLGFAGKL